MSRRFRGGRCVPVSYAARPGSDDRLAKVFGAEAESLMMDRHDEMSAGFVGHVHGLFRSAVRMDPGIVSADRHDRQIDGTGSAQLANESLSAVSPPKRIRWLFLSRM